MRACILVLLLALMASAARAQPTAAARVLVASQVWVCAVNERAELYCKLLGRGEGVPPSGLTSDLPSFERVAGVSDTVEVDAHGKYVCALDTRGRVQCWGCAGERACSLWPHAIALPEPAQHLAVSAVGACALLRSGSVQCWAGDGSAKPVALARDVKQVSALARGYCALHAAGTVSCWQPDAAPAQVAGIAHASQLATGLTFGCVIAGPRDEVSCWGLSAPSLRAARDKPAEAQPAREPVVRLSELQHVVQLTAGNLFAVAITEDGAAYQWGGYDDHWGQRASDSKDDKQVHIDLTPARLTLPSRARRAIVGNHFMCFDLQEVQEGSRVCERALARRRPFDLREVWPGVRFDGDR